jgi:hypothetical protein
MFILVTIVAVNLVVSGILWQAYDKTEFDLETTQMVLRNLMQKVQATSQYVAVGNITLKFLPYQPVQTIPGTTITYLIGFVTISNLSNIIARPLTLSVFFEPNVTYPEWGNFTYDYTDSQVLTIPPTLDVVQIPWGAFPIQAAGFRKGDIITWDMTITAIADWIGHEVARVQLVATFKFIVT